MAQTSGKQMAEGVAPVFQQERNETETYKAEPSRKEHGGDNPSCATAENHYPVKKVCVTFPCLLITPSRNRSAKRGQP